MRLHDCMAPYKKFEKDVLQNPIEEIWPSSTGFDGKGHFRKLCAKKAQGEKFTSQQSSEI